MKIPEKAPVITDDLRKQSLTPDLFEKISGLIKKSNSEYLYWDELKYQPMPEGITPEHVWAMLKVIRFIQARRLALEDSNGNPFSYWLPDCVHRESHYIDQQAGGAILMDDPTVSSEEKRRYMIRSLVDEAISSSQIEGAVTTRSIAKEMLRTMDGNGRAARALTALPIRPHAPICSGSKTWGC